MTESATDTDFLRQALALAEVAATQNEVPVGALIVQHGNIIGRGHNQPIQTHDPSAHAEIIALRYACHTVNNYRLPAGCTLYVTLEPCMMCLSAMVHARVDRVVYGAADHKTGVLGGAVTLQQATVFNHSLKVSGPLLPEACGDILKRFFKQRR